MDAIITGTLSDTDTDIVLLVKVISTETAEVIAAGRMKFPKTSEFQQLLGKGIFPNSEASGAAVTGGTTAGSVDTKAIATKEIGQLRISLKNVVPLRATGRNGTVITMGVVCSFEFTNLDLQKNLKVANNTLAVPRGNAKVLCSKVTDSDGHEWILHEATGLAAVISGDSASIVKLIESGQYETHENPLQGWGTVNKGIWGGDFSTITPGKSLRVSMTFDHRNEQGDENIGVAKAFDFFQLESELVIGF